MKRLVLIRHSQTLANERRLYYGKTDLPLSEAGRALCAACAGRLNVPEAGEKAGNAGEVEYACSGLKRAEETLLLLFHPAKWRRLDALDEMDMGAFEMRGYEDLKDLPAYQAWLSDDTGLVRIPGGECNREVAARVSACVDGLAALPGDTLIAVCHGGPIAHAMRHFFPDDPRSFYDWIPNACCGWTVEFEGGRAVGCRPVRPDAPSAENETSV